jgi:phage terminase Nu1 subunit (DNA packaging protein)
MTSEDRTVNFPGSSGEEPGEAAVGAPRQPVGTLPGRKVTRSAAAAALRVSVTTVRRWEGALLHPERGPDGVHVFDLDEIEALVRQRPAQEERGRRETEGEIAAAAFALFKKGADPRDVVIELEQPPEAIKKLHAEWYLMSDRLIIGEDTVKVLDRMSSARLIDPEVLSAIYGDDHQWLRDYVARKLDERRAQRRRTG